jgi:hypothetical protein
MRHVTPIETPSLFSPELLDTTDSLDIVAQSAEKSPEILARDFVRWCWSFGDEFRNSPDITNLRFWLRRKKLRPSSTEEEQILAEARRLFLKKVELAVRKADVPKDKD